MSRRTRRPTTFAAASPPAGRPRSEFVLLASVVLLGAALRCLFPGRMAVEHFDEGVYASNRWFAEGSYPARHLYAPPLLPALLEWSELLFGPTHLGTMLVGLLFGSATVPLAWWTARRWFGPGAGLSAAILAATSDVHLAFSRTALTDGPVTFWMLLAAAGFAEALREGRQRRLWNVAAGTATGLAWATKYNGWLPLGFAAASVVVGAAAAAIAAGGKRSRGADAAAGLRPLAGCLAAAVVAGIIWLPVWHGLQAVGGYAVVAANHRLYFTGVAGWWDSAVRQAANLQFLDGWLSAAGVGLALLLPRIMHLGDSIAPERFTWNAAGGIVLAAGVAVAVSAWLGSSAVLGVLAGAGLFRAMLQDLWRLRDSDAPAEPNRPLWLLAAWYFGLLSATPLYTPYPRLTLPWLAAAWLAAAGLPVVRCRWSAVDAREFASTGNGRVAIAAVGLCLVVAGTAWLAETQTARGVAAWQPRTEIARAAASIAQTLDAQPDSAGVEAAQRPAIGLDGVCFVYAEPAVLFHLAAEDARRAEVTLLVQPTADLAGVVRDARRLDLPTYLLAGPHADRDSNFAAAWPGVADRMQLLAEISYTPSDLVLLDSHGPAELFAGRPSERLRLFRVNRGE